MLKAGVTGGVGSGKTTVCQVFATLGIPVFYADDAARYLMENDAALIDGIRRLLGDVYINGRLHREKVSAIIYRQPDKRARLNALVHPATIQYAKEWMEKQAAPYIIKEAAIFFETGSDKDMDVMIGVYAPEEERMQRAMRRGNLSREQVLAIMAQQMDDVEKIKRCNYVINNDGVHAVLPQVMELHEILLSLAKSERIKL